MGLLSASQASDSGLNLSRGLTQVTPMRLEEMTNCKFIL